MSESKNDGCLSNLTFILAALLFTPMGWVALIIIGMTLASVTSGGVIFMDECECEETTEP